MKLAAFLTFSVVTAGSAFCATEAQACGGWFQSPCPKARLTVQPVNQPVKRTPVAAPVVASPSLAPRQPSTPLIAPTRVGAGVISNDGGSLTRGSLISQDGGGLRRN